MAGTSARRPSIRLGELRDHVDELGVTPQEPVRRLSPSQLAGTASKVVLAGVFAGYSDNSGTHNRTTMR